MLRKLKNVDVELISILEFPVKPANKKPVVLKADNKFEISRVVKADNTAGLLYVTVMSANEVDTDGEIVSREEVLKAAHNFLKKSDVKRVDKNHDLVVNDKVQIVESYVDKDGSWQCVIDISGDENLLMKAKEGRITGVSIFGSAEVEKKKDDDEDAKNFVWAAAFEKLDKLIKTLSFRNVKKENGVVSEDDMKKVVDLVLEALEKKYDLKPKKDEDNDETKAEIEKLKKSIETLAAARQTSEGDEGSLTYKDLLDDPVALVKMQTDEPEKYEALRMDFLVNG